MPSAREKALERLIQEERARTAAAQKELRDFKEALAFWEAKDKGQAGKVRLEVRRTDLLTLRMALAYDRDARFEELGVESALETEEVRILRNLIRQIDLHLSEGEED